MKYLNLFHFILTFYSWTDQSSVHLRSVWSNSTTSNLFLKATYILCTFEFCPFSRVPSSFCSLNTFIQIKQLIQFISRNTNISQWLNNWMLASGFNVVLFPQLWIKKNILLPNLVMQAVTLNSVPKTYVLYFLVR